MTSAAQATPAAPTRTVVAHARGNGAVIYDPLSGQTYRADTRLAVGRFRLGDAEIASRPEIHPAAMQMNAPISVCWSPLVRCNLVCPHCLDDKSVPELQRAERHRVAHLLANSKVLGVDISGGEPLLLRELPELIDILTAGGCAVSVTTNGTHLARRAEALAGRADAVRVSLDGANARGHDRWRGDGSFDRAVAGIRAAVAYGIPTQIQTVLLRSTARRSAQPMVELAEALGVRGVTFLQMLPIGEGATLAEEEQLTDEEAHDVVGELSVRADVAVRLRTRRSAGGFTVIRADGQVWRNQSDATAIATLHPLLSVSDLTLTGQDGSA
ncbi:radical SAM protein [Amycolatopsis sp. NPDC058986]|uniref:radical SAM protein n=1 Tax=unclassified Amycolatopsis TaxID=2618356 RepID=UPI003671C78A